MEWKTVFQIASVLFCFITSVLAIRRGLKLSSWSKMKGIVLGPETHLDTSAVKIEFTDPAGFKRIFISNVRFGHYYKASREKRLPFQHGEEINILVNPKDFSQAELATSIYLWIGFLLLIVTFILANNFYRMNL